MAVHSIVKFVKPKRAFAKRIGMSLEIFGNRKRNDALSGFCIRSWNFCSELWREEMCITVMRGRVIVFIIGISVDHRDGNCIGCL